MVRLFSIVIFCFTIIFSQSKTNIAVMEIEGNGISEEEVAGLTNRLRTELFQTNKFTVLERSKMDEILKEQGFQILGCTNTECAIEIGKIVGVQKVILGSVDKVSNLISVNIRLVNVETGIIEKNVMYDCENCDLVDVMKNSLYRVSRKIADIDIKYENNKQNFTSSNDVEYYSVNDTLVNVTIINKRLLKKNSLLGRYIDYLEFTFEFYNNCSKDISAIAGDVIFIDKNTKEQIFALNIIQDLRIKSKSTMKWTGQMVYLETVKAHRYLNFVDISELYTYFDAKSIRYSDGSRQDF